MGSALNGVDSYTKLSKSSDWGSYMSCYIPIKDKCEKIFSQIQNTKLKSDNLQELIKDLKI